MFVLQSLAVALITTLVAYYANYRWKRRRFYELASKLPQKQGLPLLGFLHRFIFRSYKEYLNVVTELIETDKEPITSLWLGPLFISVINSPENLQTVLNSPKCQKKPSTIYDVWQCEKGLVLAHGSLWKRHRKILNNAFTLNVLQEFFPIFNNKSLKSIKNLEIYVDNEEFDAYEIVAAASLETLMKGNFNYDQDFMKDPHNDALLKTVEK